ncbi:hypothetical protein PHMEG_00012310 [Phytophthora megakarya]|uniref:Uncharacterized protein n=1 Tax=Phytophthora megakarya TaxID=4795 RepID=A0A225WAR7_9STRA|nr:hypothetical protein PHMEG_00012310 [Phytophthora megakarya]
MVLMLLFCWEYLVPFIVVLSPSLLALHAGSHCFARGIIRRSIETYDEITLWSINRQPNRSFSVIGTHKRVQGFPFTYGKPACHSQKLIDEHLTAFEKLHIIRAHEYFLEEARNRRDPKKRAVRQRVATCLAVTEDMVKRTAASTTTKDSQLGAKRVVCAKVRGGTSSRDKKTDRYGYSASYNAQRTTTDGSKL